MKQITHIYSVSELTKNIKILLENSFPGVWVEGEISNLRTPVSGHSYFTLKDKNAQIASVLFKNSRNFLKFELKDGQKIVAFGKIGVYEPRGSYQFYVEEIEPKGIGALAVAFEQLKLKLEKEGLFDKERKKTIPLLPRRIGIVTSKTGAAIKDILNVVDRRFANVEIILRPVKVQGQGAAEEIAQAIEEFNEFSSGRRKKIDVLIVGRGGGSLEDLWAFNEEVTARAIFKSAIPVISAVGHQIDYTIADFAADLRAPTPSAAAELVVASKEHLIENLEHLGARLKTAAQTNLEYKFERLKNLERACVFRSPENKILYNIERLDEISEKISKAVKYFLQISEHRLKNITGRLETLNPLSILARGYSVSFLLPDEKVITEAKVLKSGDEVLTKVKKGSFVSTVKEIREAENG